jgi:hypothetical protein
MVVSMKLAAAVIGGVLFATLSTPAWAGSAGDAAYTGSPTDATQTTGASSSAGGADRSVIGVLSPLLADVGPHQAQKNCKQSSLYSQHDVVGDPDACFLNRVNVPLP